MIGGEAEASPGWLKFGQWYISPSSSPPMDSFLLVPFLSLLSLIVVQVINSRYKWAEQHGAALFQLEHR